MSEQESMDHLLRQLMAGNPAPAVSSAFDQRLARRLRPSRLGPVGRMVMSLYTLSFFGMFPLGALLSGTVAEVIGEPTTVALGALVTIAFGGMLWLYVPQLRGLE